MRTRSKVYCLTCGTRYILEGESSLQEVSGSGIRLFTLEEQLEHKEWLLRMKTRFMEMRRELKRIVSENIKPGEVI